MRGSSKDHPIVSVVVSSPDNDVDGHLQQALTKLTHFDPTVSFSNSTKGGTFVLEGRSVTQLEVICDRICDEYHLAIDVGTPRAILLETVRETVEAEGKYIRQVGGCGNYGHCKLRVEPNELGKGYEFINLVSGDRISEEYVASIDHGVKNCMRGDARSGRPLVDLKVTLIDGSYHDADSNRHAFESAGVIAFDRALAMASRVVLQPMMAVEVGLPKELAKAIAHDVIERRGRVERMDTENNWTEITAIVPLSELLVWLTGGFAAFPAEFSGFEPMPGDSDEIGTPVSVNNPRRPRQGGFRSSSV